MIMHYMLTFICLFIVLSGSAVHADSNLAIHNLISPKDGHLYSGEYTENPHGKTEHEITVNGNIRSYYIYAQDQIVPKPRPAILLLHGAQRTGISMIEHWEYLAKKHDIILIAPNGYNNVWDSQKDGTPLISAVIKDASQRHPVDSKRLYMFGHSAGGNMALHLSIKHADHFAAAAIHAGHIADASQYPAIDNAKRKIPVGLIVGSNDQLFPLESVFNTAKAFSTRGHKAELYAIEGHNHWYYDISYFINEKAWDFLSQYQLK